MAWLLYNLNHNKSLQLLRYFYASPLFSGFQTRPAQNRFQDSGTGLPSQQMIMDAARGNACQNIPFWHIYPKKAKKREKSVYLHIELYTTVYFIEFFYNFDFESISEIYIYST